MQKALRKSLADQGYEVVTAGTTDSSGDIHVEDQEGPCGDLSMLATETHEKVHQKHTRELEKRHGKGTPEFESAWNDAKDWVQDELNAHQADQDVMNKFKAECKDAGS